MNPMTFICLCFTYNKLNMLNLAIDRQEFFKFEEDDLAFENEQVETQVIMSASITCHISTVYHFFGWRKLP